MPIRKFKFALKILPFHFFYFIFPRHDRFPKNTASFCFTPAFISIQLFHFFNVFTTASISRWSDTVKGCASTQNLRLSARASLDVTAGNIIKSRGVQ